jgi:DNA-binding NtrC family response regulator
MSATLQHAQPSHCVLIVDDQPDVLALLRRSLRDLGCRILTTSSPAAALEMMRANEIDILVSDIDMPGMSGLDLVARARKEAPHVVRILLTGHAALESAMRAVNEGEVHRYLTKPWNDAELLGTLRDAIRRLEELRRGAAAAHVAARRVAVMADLEREHPGITRVDRVDGAHLLDEPRIEAFAKGIDATDLGVFLPSAAGDHTGEPRREPT